MAETEPNPAIAGAVAHPIGERLRKAGIKGVVILDDAYDPPTSKDATPDDVAEFWRSVSADGAAKAELREMKEVEEASDIDIELIADLWQGFINGKLKALETIAREKLFASKLQQTKDVEILRDNLRAIGFEPQVLGSRDEPPATAGLVFLDYILDPNRKENPEEPSTKKAIALEERGQANEMPFLVLMSDKPDAPREQEKFRKDSKFLGGLFGFMSKADAVIKEKLYLRLGSWGLGSETHRDLQRFVNAVVSAADDAADKFRERVRALSVQDYAFIQRMSLLNEGQPLGDYMLWLFEASLGYGLRDRAHVKKVQEKLDAMQFEKYLPCQNPPSHRLAEFFLSAVTEPAVKEMTAHPHDPDGSVPLLGLGDIFVKNADSSVYMVVTAACDLQFSPVGNRACDLEQPVYLAPGSLQPIENRVAADNKKIRTELISYNGKAYQIVWDVGHVESRRMKEVWTYLLNNEYERRWRLKLPYALVVQQAFANQISRIGMPVPPPIFGRADIEVFCKGADGKSIALGSKIEGGVVLIHGRDADHFVLTIDCADKLMKHVGEAATKLETQVQSYDAQNQTRLKFEGKAKDLRNFNENATTWIDMLETPSKLPKAGGPALDVSKGLLCAFRETDLSETFSASATIALNIVPRTMPSADTPKPASAGAMAETVPAQGTSVEVTPAMPAEIVKAAATEIPKQNGTPK